MLNHNRSRPVSQSCVTNRRALLVIAALAIGAGGWTSRPTLAGQFAVAAPAIQIPAVNDLPRGVAYVGHTSDPTALIAIVLSDDVPGEVVAFVSNGQDVSLWFTGRMRAGMFTLTAPAPTWLAFASEGTLAEPVEPTLTGQFDLYGLAGEIALQDRLLSFRTAGPAAGIGGLYVANRDASGVVRGHGSTGATLSAQQTAVTGGDAPYRIAGTIVLVDGSQHEVAIPAWTDDVAAIRWIILPGGEIRSAGRQPARAGAGFVDETIF